MGKENPAVTIGRLRREVAWWKGTIVQRENAGVQIAKDAAMMAAADVFQCGPGRAEKFSKAIDAYIIDLLTAACQEVAETENARGKTETDIYVTRTKTDERLRQIFGAEKFRPWEERYCWNDVNRLLQTPVGQFRQANGEMDNGKKNDG